MTGRFKSKSDPAYQSAKPSIQSETSSNSDDITYSCEIIRSSIPNINIVPPGVFLKESFGTAFDLLRVDVDIKNMKLWPNSEPSEDIRKPATQFPFIT